MQTVYATAPVSSGKGRKMALGWQHPFSCPTGALVAKIDDPLIAMEYRVPACSARDSHNCLGDSVQ